MSSEYVYYGHHSLTLCANLMSSTKPEVGLHTLWVASTVHRCDRALHFCIGFDLVQVQVYFHVCIL